jgi:hypothetical protein
MPTPDERTPEVEHQYHRYRGSEIPWYVHTLWVSFWLLAAAYVVLYLLPVLPQELRSPP